MSDECLRRINIAIDNVHRVIDECSEEYAIIINADHGGHDRTHETDMDEDFILAKILKPVSSFAVEVYWILHRLSLNL